MKHTPSQATGTPPRKAAAQAATALLMVPKHVNIFGTLEQGDNDKINVARAGHLNTNMFKAMVAGADVEAPRAFKAYKVTGYQGKLDMWKVHMMSPGDVV